MFKLTIKTDNAAFEDDKGAEVSEILRTVISRVYSGETSGICRDGNGNRVGEWSFTNAKG